MDGHLEDLDPPPTTPLVPRLLGRGLPVPPLVALVAVVGVFAGIVLGYGIAPKPGPLPPSPTGAVVPSVGSTSRAGSPAPSVAPTAEPIGSGYEIPPAGGISLSEALAASNKNLPLMLSIIGPNIEESAVIYARVELWAPPGHTTPDHWVWFIAIRGSFQPALCRGPQPTPQACPGPYTTAMIVVDYKTGEVLATGSPAFP